MKEFEYKVVESRIAAANVNRNDAELFLNTLGKDGWELCAADNSHFVFKREVEIDMVGISGKF